MTAPIALTWDTAAIDGGARRPSLADVGGALLENKAGSPPPETGTHLYAKMCNQWQKQLAALARMIPSAKLTIAFVAGAPTILKLQTASANLTTADFTVVDNGVGNTSIRWTTTKLPAPTCDPELSLHNVGTHCGSPILTLNSPTANVHDITVITTLGSSGAAVDVKFTLSIN